MTRLQYTLGTEAFRKQESWRMLVLLASMLCGIPITNWVGRHLGERSPWGALSLAPFAGAAVWMIWSMKSLGAKYGLLCPNCRRSIFPSRDYKPLITGCCRRCQHVLFDRIPRAASNANRSGLLVRKEFIARLDAIRRREHRHLWIALIIFVVGLGAGIPLTRHVMLLVDRA